MATKGYNLEQTGEQVQEALNKVINLAPATVDTAGLMSAADKEKLNSLPTGATLESSLGAKVDKVTGKGLSTNDYDNSEKSKVASAYQKPGTGIPKEDLSDGVKASLGNADSASQDVADIKTKIPSQATAQNQLADKAFVNSSISMASADFKGTYDSLAELQAVTADKNDYGYVVSTDEAGNTVYSRYKYNGSSWVFEYDLNNSSFTAAEWASIQSQITAALVQKLSALPTNQELGQSLSGKQDIISDLSTIRSGAAAGATAYQKPASGVPASDMASGVQTSLGKADTAYQKPGTGIPASDLASGVIPDVSGFYTKPANGIPASDIATGVIPTVPTISTNLSADAASDVKTSSPKSVKTYVDAGIAAVESDLSDLEDVVGAIDIGAYVMAWDGNSEPVVANIPAGVSVTYNSTTYTGTLAAGASTAQKIYLVATGTTDNYDRYITVGDSTYSWVNLGTTEITLADYATKEKVSQLQQEVHNLSGKYYGIFEDAESLPEGDAVGYAFVGTEAPFAIYQFDGEDWTDSGATVDSIQGEPGVGFESVESPDPADGTVIITLSNGDTMTLDLNHDHLAYPKYYLCDDEAEYTAITTKDSATLYLIPES